MWTIGSNITHAADPLVTGLTTGATNANADDMRKCWEVSTSVIKTVQNVQ